MKVCNYCNKSFDHLFHPKYCSISCRLYSKAIDIGGCRIVKKSINYSGHVLSAKEAVSIINCGRLVAYGYKTTCGNKHCVHPRHILITDLDDSVPYVVSAKTYFCKVCKVKKIKLPNRFCSKQCCFDSHAIKMGDCVIVDSNKTVSFSGTPIRMYKLAMELKTGVPFDGNGIGRTCDTAKCYALDHIFPDYGKKGRSDYMLNKTPHFFEYPEKSQEEALEEFLRQR
jgi:hypothetical protein